MKARTQLLVRFGYLGDRFSGVQPLRDRPTAGGALYARIRDAFGEEPAALCFAARTDAGVHARRNLATCFLRRALDDDEVQRLTARIEAPRDDGLLAVRVFAVPRDVHARGSARGKRYRYIVDDGAPEPDDPHHPTSRHMWRIAPALDVERMRAAAAHLVGTHDFTSFRGGKDTGASAIKTLHAVRVRGPYPLDDGARRVIIELVGDAFLRKMVRNVVGVLVEIGTGWRPADDVDAILGARSRAAAGLCAPPFGLTLVDVGCTWPPDGRALLPELVRAERASSP